MRHSATECHCIHWPR